MTSLSIDIFILQQTEHLFASVTCVFFLHFSEALSDSFLYGPCFPKLLVLLAFPVRQILLIHFVVLFLSLKLLVSYKTDSFRQTSIQIPFNQIVIAVVSIDLIYN